MKCVVPGANVRILAKAIHALAKIGDEMYIEPQSNALSFRTVNLANSAYADFTFNQTYFSYYSCENLQDNDALKCKISMRSAMAVFKAPNVIDKQVETCHIKLEPDASEIVFILKYKNSIIKTHLLPILDSEMLQTAYNTESATNQLSSNARVLGDVIPNFQQNLIEITLEVSPQKLLLRNYVDDASGLANTTRTQLALAKGEFDKYNINNDTSITFCMKEFKAILNFAENVLAPISIFFEQAGKPVIFGLKNPAFEAHLILSTLSADADSQTDTTIIRQEKSARRLPRKRRTPRKSNKSKLDNRTAKENKTLTNTSGKDDRSKSVERKEQTNSEKTVNRKSNKSIQKIDDSKRTEQQNQKELDNEPSTSYSTSAKSVDRSASGKSLAKSIFSSITKRKSGNDKPDNCETDRSVFEEAIPNSPSPPAKKARLIFQKCFQTTFDPRTLPGYDEILAEDSDECSNG